MYYQNKYDRTGECSVMGERAETSFHKLLTQRGRVISASDSQQRNHVDLILEKPDGGRVKYEVKSRKKVNRADDGPKDEWIWIELINVVGNLGWLYGEADKIAFEQAQDFIVVDREKLAAMVKTKCKPFDIAYSAGDALYRGYRRNGRRDHLTIVLASDVRAIADEVMPKS